MSIISSRFFTGLFWALFCCLPGAFAQISEHGSIWYFGYGAGLNFNAGAPVPLTGINVDSYEGCTIYCDADGHVLFYSNGGGDNFPAAYGLRDGIIWGRNQQVIYNMGQDKGGGYSSPQSAIVVPKPGSAAQYYLFTMDHNANLPIATNRGLSYFLIDMALNGGLGTVTQANVPVYKPASECLTALPQANGTDFWVVTVDSNQYDFVVLPVTAAGIGAPVKYPRAQNDKVSVIKASPDGKYLFADGELYDFNATTGAITLHTLLPLSSYTFTFSPASRYLYGFKTDASVEGIIVRYDLQAPDILASVQEITPPTSFSFNGLMQLGPDGNIYFNEQNEDGVIELKQSIGVIRCPDAPAPEVQRSLLLFDTDPTNSLALFTSLPNFADYIFAIPPTSDTLNAAFCGTAGTMLSPPSQWISYQWSTGDTTAKIQVTTAGLYTVQVSNACGTQTYTFKVTTGFTDFRLETPVIADSCAILPVTLRARYSGTGTVLWSDGSTADTLLVTAYGTYSATFSNGCTASDTITLQEPAKDCCTLQKPNVFTPNLDGVNDTFSPLLPGCKVVFAELMVYSRWGELMFQSEKNTDTWDGSTVNGTNAQADVYVYTFRYQLEGEVERVEKGDVTLIR